MHWGIWLKHFKGTTMDNLISTIDLFEERLQKSVLCCGTLRMNRNGCSEALKGKTYGCGKKTSRPHAGTTMCDARGMTRQAKCIYCRHQQRWIALHPADMIQPPADRPVSARFRMKTTNRSCQCLTVQLWYISIFFCLLMCTFVRNEIRNILFVCYPHWY